MSGAQLLIAGCLGASGKRKITNVRDIHSVSAAFKWAFNFTSGGWRVWFGREPYSLSTVPTAGGVRGFCQSSGAAACDRTAKFLGDRRADVAIRSYGRPFAKIVVSACGPMA